MPTNALTKTVTREQLYQDVWSKPGTKLTAEYGVSDVAIWKACRRLNVPKPPPGYWAKVRAGKKVKRPDLPPITDGVPASKTFYPAGSNSVPELAVPDAVDSEPASIAGIEVPKDLRRCHPLVAKTLRAAESGVESEHGFLKSNRTGTLNLLVRRRLLPRALRIMEALIRAFEQRGWKTEAWGRGRETRVLVGDDAFSLDLTEELTVKGNAYEPTGRLILALDKTPRGVSTRWADDKAHHLEEKLPEVIAAIENAAEEARVRRLEFIEYQHRRAEELRQAGIAGLQQEEEAARVRREKQRREQLEADAYGYQRARVIWAMCDEVERRAKEDPAGYPREATKRWLQWARSIAAKHDPFENGRIFEALQDEELDESLDCR